jgi:hypothetical protein
MLRLVSILLSSCLDTFVPGSILLVLVAGNRPGDEPREGLAAPCHCNQGQVSGKLDEGEPRGREGAGAGSWFPRAIGQVASSSAEPGRQVH